MYWLALLWVYIPLTYPNTGTIWTPYNLTRSRLCHILEHSYPGHVIRHMTFIWRLQYGYVYVICYWIFLLYVPMDTSFAIVLGTCMTLGKVFHIYGYIIWQNNWQRIPHLQMQYFTLPWLYTYLTLGNVFHIYEYIIWHCYGYILTDSWQCIPHLWIHYLTLP